MTTARSTIAPLLLGPNQPEARPYRGGAGIRALRGEGSTSGWTPEDFVGSTTCIHGSDSIGLSTLPDGRLLRDAVAGDPTGWLGPGHPPRLGTDTGLLVKLLSTGERLFTHVHPDAEFAAAHFGTHYGKTEAWLIVDTGDAPTGDVWLGFARDVARDQLEDWFERQDIDALREALNHVEVRAGDWVYVPAGTVHAIGPDITLVELQEPVDLSIVLEYAPFPALDRASALLGLPLASALDAVPLTRLDAARLDALHGRASAGPLLPTEADEAFRAELVEGRATLDAAFAVLVVLEGEGTLRWDDGELPLTRGATVLVPHGAGQVSLEGEVRAIRCLPPSS
ncbi:class I mannose-6-phosphate isomerase [Microbacterium oryzae]|uniref:Phosphohexomutase n=1 Tax=Microbacterium oryzae TaxID=743009 RepID=A0A6I6DTB6_9MICO|nr:class I mannose-6-phosphate isomerase [Microbacterium oryzae]QGU28245.1 hypothetical protein D7D94_11580 [Microbacterium oryzae]